MINATVRRKIGFNKIKAKNRGKLSSQHFSKTVNFAGGFDTFGGFFAGKTEPFFSKKTLLGAL
jgi:hypothetical protein